ncbi:hypothetical protein PAEPH01_0538 [Pancytospora epiphaga]|nr:hypothetical protein PAEPH01_0538 [Pancytospora epiphaga]
MITFPYTMLILYYITVSIKLDSLLIKIFIINLLRLSPSMVVSKGKLPSIKLNTSENSKNVDRKVGNEFSKWKEEKQSYHTDEKLGNCTVLRKEIRSKIRWSDAEMEALLSGVEDFGEGNWATILYDREGIFHRERRVVDLVHKYRQYLKASSFYTTTKMTWLYVDNNGEIITDRYKGSISYVEKFPYTAASRIAKKLGLKEGELKEINVVSTHAEGMPIHYYRATVYNGKLIVRKVVSPYN